MVSLGVRLAQHLLGFLVPFRLHLGLELGRADWMSTCVYHTSMKVWSANLRIAVR